MPDDRGRRQAGGLAARRGAVAGDEQRRPGDQHQRIGDQMGHHQRLPEVHEAGPVGQVDRAAGAQDVELQAQHGEQARQRRHEARHAEPVEQHGIDRADDGADQHGDEDRAEHRPAGIDPEHADDRRREARHGADRQVDLADHQDAHDAERDDADGGAVEQQVDEVVGRQEHGVQRLEHGPDHGEADDHRQRAEVARAHAVEEGPDGAAEPLVVADAGVGAVEGGRARLQVDAHARASPVVVPRRTARRETELSAAPVMALTSSWFDVSG